MDWDSTRHRGDVAQNGVATFDDVIHDWRETSLVCNVDNAEVILPSDADFSRESSQEFWYIQHVYGPCLCSVQKRYG